jgi:glucoamylase
MDNYDGNVGDGETPGGHPWVPCTCNFAEYYYKLALKLKNGEPLVFSDLTRDFYAQVGITQGASVTQAVTLLTEAGDRMLRAIVYHSDRLELSEQFNGTSGFECSVRNLTWSYASYISAVRARKLI